jgi:LysR family hydrogen peroxide-inducible transcriptional activator
MLPTLRQLEYVVALSRTLNFRQAAEACDVTQPTLSGQVQQLETLLGLTLFDRDKRGVRVTEAGQKVVDRAERVVSEAESLVEAAHASSRPLEGPLSLGVIPTIAPYLLPRAIPPVREAHPELELYLREETTAALVEKVATGALDLALLALEADLGGLHSLHLFDEPFLVAMPVGHPLAELDAIPEAALTDESLLLLEEGHCLRSQALAVCARAGADQLAGFGATSLPTLLEMVAGGLGITLVPEMATRDPDLSSRVVLRPFEDPAPQRGIGLVWRPSSLRGEEFKALAAILATV